MAQFRYHIAVECGGLSCLSHARFEQLCGIRSDWDYLTEENAERSMSVMPDIILYLVGLASRSKLIPFKKHVPR